MTSKEERIHKDLAKLAAERAENAINTVLQLVDHEEGFRLRIYVLARLANEAAEHMMDKSRDETGAKVPKDIATMTVMMGLSSCLGLKAASVTEEQIKDVKGLKL